VILTLNGPSAGFRPPLQNISEPLYLDIPEMFNAVKSVLRRAA